MNKAHPMSTSHNELGAFVAVLVVALMSFVSSPAHAQCTGFAVGCAVQWEMPVPRGTSVWRAGAYSGVIEEVSSETGLIDLATERAVNVRMNQLYSITCVPGAHQKLKVSAKDVPVCVFQGSLSGPRGVSSWGHLRVRLFDEIVLSDGTTARSYSGHYENFGRLTLGQGPNRWAKAAATTQPGAPQQQPKHTTIPDPSKPQVTPHIDQRSPDYLIVPEIGQSYAQALKVGYPAVVQATMSSGRLRHLPVRFRRRGVPRAFEERTAPGG